MLIIGGSLKAFNALRRALKSYQLMNDAQAPVQFTTNQQTPLYFVDIKQSGPRIFDRLNIKIEYEKIK
jgi:hypothetical protein